MKDYSYLKNKPVHTWTQEERDFVLKHGQRIGEDIDRKKRKGAVIRGVGILSVLAFVGFALRAM